MGAYARSCFPLSIAASCWQPVARSSLPWKLLGTSPRPLAARALTTTTTPASSRHHLPNFTWDDVLRAAEAEHWPGELPGLQGYAHKVQKCNRGSGLLSDFLPFVIEGQVVGYIHPCIIDHLKKFPDAFSLDQNNNHGNSGDSYVTLHSSLRSPDDRTDTVGDTIKCLGESIVPGIRNELYPVTSAFGMPVFFSLERAAAPLFGIKAYGVHMNGYTEKEGKKYLWIGKRSYEKPTFPGMLDHLVAGGLPYGITCKDNLLKECEEEAGIPRNIANEALAASAVSYMDIEGYRLKRDVLFCYDLKLPDDFIPNNQDGEVSSFKLIPVTQVANIIRRTEFFKPNCALVIIDFLFRHGLITPDDSGYLELLQSLRRGECT
ncbi:nudix hydrolase 20, chloroplastic-like [Nymphaea colorata]|nr:nudix hydrolase 20, chloroplastic-like [Nymphaea colorata]XP_031501230.1 nudix hydrolase 20, chloroplastic-like [Nymphaea colorata]